MAQFARAHVFVYARCLATVVRIDGEIDASNAKDLAEAIRSFARLKTPVVVDLSRLRFISVDGFQALLFVNDELRKARVHCSVVTGTALRPLLRIVHDNGLATTDSVPEAFQAIEDMLAARRRLLADLPRLRRPRIQVGRSAAS
ncbi:STAS domain-containing protein [Mycobacterium sp. 852002-10029_SCH5224772]|uniref:STAS domain-containing protein n=1 Tax=Mycobacterium sp. 852002-10029_SCH5224772 TaxID=1834083 RepID=UPI0007FCD253|nr:STAS domain-containing protein [Mycobacterium sp. 852002-10029_SCH5224772]OBF10628.1 sulfate transporter [Mycobacterium sp. 852002-10029_SCH5224772]